MFFSGLGLSLFGVFPGYDFSLVKSFSFFWLGAFHRYDSPQHIMEEFFTLRMEFYHRRKTSLMNKMQSEWSKLDNKVGKPTPRGTRLLREWEQPTFCFAAI